MRPRPATVPDQAPLAIRCQQIGKSYGSARILDGVDLEVESGEFFGLVGINGAGKTTLLKCLLDFCGLDAGAIEIFAISHRLTDSRRHLTFLPERFMPPYYLTGEDFLKYTLKLHGLPYEQVKAEALLRKLDLQLSALTSPVRSCSKGMTQKLGLAACLLANKALNIFDEPMSGLDPRARAMLKERLQAMRETGHTLFFSSHALADVEEICDRMAILHEGRVRFVGTPENCRQMYQAKTLEQAFLKCIANKD